MTGESGWLLGRAVSMETKVPVGRAEGRCPTPPVGLLMTPEGPAFPALFRVYLGPSLALLLPSSPTSSLSANPVGSTFRRYPKSDHFSPSPLFLLWPNHGHLSLGCLQEPPNWSACLRPSSQSLSLFCSKTGQHLRTFSYESHILYNVLHVLVTWLCTITAASPVTLPSRAPIQHALQPLHDLWLPGLLLPMTFAVAAPSA